MATTRLMPLHIGKGRDVGMVIRDIALSSCRNVKEYIPIRTRPTEDVNKDSAVRTLADILFFFSVINL